MSAVFLRPNTRKPPPPRCRSRPRPGVCPLCLHEAPGAAGALAAPPGDRGPACVDGGQRLIPGARQGAEALEILEGGVRPTLIVLDIVMPIMGGDQFLKELRANQEFKNIPVLVTSATKEKPPAAEGFVAKPFELATLFEAARPYLPAGANLNLSPA